MTATLENEYKMTMTLNIRNISAELFGGYRCVVRNSLGETDGLIRLYGMRDRQRENIITVLFKPPLEYDRSGSIVRRLHNIPIYLKDLR